MKFDDIDRRMRVFETAFDLRVLPGLWIVVRLDGRSFTRLTKEVLALEAPFDVRFRDAMVDTVAELMTCGPTVLFAYTQSDEISLLLQRDDVTFERKVRKLESVLAGEASARLSVRLGVAAAFDGRVSHLPDDERVVEYFRWRQEDATRNALNGTCYWTLRRLGLSARAASRQLEGRGAAYKNELLFENGTNFDRLPLWQKRGVGLYWEAYERAGMDPRTGAVTRTTRRRIRRDLELPARAELDELVRRLIEPLRQPPAAESRA